MRGTMESIPYLLYDSARLLRREFDNRVRALGLTGQQARLLFNLSRNEGENQGFYAEQLEVEPISLTRMIDRMVDAGLIERRPDPADRRAWRVHLTDRSRAVIEQARECVAALESDILASIDPATLAALYRGLETIRMTLTHGREAAAVAHG